MKKVVSLFMAVIMIFSIAVPSFAASAAETAQLAYASEADAVSSSDDIFSDAIGGVVDFFKKAIDTIVDFFKWLFGIDNNVPSYKITFYDGEKVINTMTVKQGDEVPSPTIPRKTGHTFIGWSPAIPEIMPAYDLEVKALWSINKYTISFDMNGSPDTVEPIVQNYGTAITPPENPVYSGYKFMGWQIWDSAEKAWVTTELPEYMPAYDVTYRAGWTERTYTIKFVDGFGGLYHTITAKNGVNIQSQLPLDPSRPGYEFDRWDYTRPLVTMPAKDLVITALWTPIMYTVKFMAEGKLVAEYNDLTYGSTLTAPVPPAVEGKEFKGWTPSVPSTVMGNATYVAQYKNKTYTVTWNINGNVKTDSYEYGATIVAPTVSAPLGHEFAGWDSTVYSKMPAKNLTYTAKFEKKDYTITFNTNGGSYVAPITAKYGAAVTAPANPTKTGYTFAGWDNTFPSTMPAENITLTAKWTINGYTITFDTDGGSAIAPITQTFGTAVAAPANPTKEGHTFAGWDRTIPSTMPGENITIKAKWTVNNYTVTWTVDGVATKVDTYAYGAKIERPEDPATAAGYTFQGWTPAIPSTMPAENLVFTAKILGPDVRVYFDTNGGGVYPDGVTTSVGWDTNVGARFEDYFNSEYVQPKCTIDGYEFDRWTTDAAGKYPIPETVPAGSTEIRVYAQWQPIEYTITFDTTFGSFEDGTKTYTIDAVSNADIAALLPGTDALKNPTRIGYTFKGWGVWNETTKKYDIAETLPAKMPTADVTYVAQWKINQYSITLYDEDENVYKYTPSATGIETEAVITQDYGTVFDMSETAPYAGILNPTLEGHTFKGWLLWNAETKKWNPSNLPSTIPAENREYKALFEENDYTISFAGVAKQKVTLKYDTEMISLDNIDTTFTGHTFKGWTWYKEGVDISIPENIKDIATLPAKMPAYNIVIVANYEKDTFTITFANTGDTKIEVIEQLYGTAVVAPADPTLIGYTFTGWDKDIPAKMPAENLVINGTWKINTYNVTFDANKNGVLVFENDEKVTDTKTIVMEYGETITLPAPVANNGYTFTGWTPKPDSTGVYVVPAENITITAQWSINKYDVLFYENYGTKDSFEILKPYGRDKIAYGDKLKDSDGNSILPELTAKYGVAPENYNAYKFVGWRNVKTGAIINGDLFVMPNEDVILNAVWEGDPVDIVFDANADGATVIVDKDVKEATLTFKCGEEIVAPRAKYEGYKLVRWEDAEGNVLPAIVPDLAQIETVEEDGSITYENQKLTYYAVWELDTFTVTYDANGGVYSDGAESVTADYKYTDTIIEPTNIPAKTGYTFAGWTDEDGNDFVWETAKLDEIGEVVTDDAGNVVMVPVINTMPARDFTLKAKWTVKYYTITFNAGEGTFTDGEKVKQVTLAYGSALTAPAVAEMPGYTNGWTPEVPKYVPAGNTTYKVIYTPIEYVVKFNPNGGKWSDDTTAVKTKGIAYETNITYPADTPLTRAGYTFGGWYTKDGSSITKLDTIGGKEIFAEWIPNGATAYKVEFYEMGTDGLYPATATDSKTFAAETASTVSVSEELLTRTGFTFVSSLSITTGKVAADGSTVLKVYFSRNKYTVSVDGAQSIYYYGSTVVAPAQPVKEGYSFEKWIDADGNAFVFTEGMTMPANNITVTSVMTANTYMVTLIGVTGYSSVPVRYGANVAAALEDAGVTNTSWTCKKTADNTAMSVPVTMPAYNITLEAK